MTEPANPKIYLITPKEIDLKGNFTEQLRAILDNFDIACLRLGLSSTDEHLLGKTADAMREICHAYDVAIIIERHMLLVKRFGLDGVHLPDGAKNVAKARKLLGKAAIVGAHCAASRHTGLNAGENSADYVSFGPVTASNLDGGEIARTELFEWWSQIIELPVVAEGQFDRKSASLIGQHADFLAFGSEIWVREDPVAELRKMMDFTNPA